MPTTRSLRKRDSNAADNGIELQKPSKRRKIGSSEVNDENKHGNNVLQVSTKGQVKMAIKKGNEKTPKNTNAQHSKERKQDLMKSEDIKVEVKADDSYASDVEVQNDSDSSNHFEERRKSNLKENAEFLASLGILEAKANLGVLTEIQKKPTRRGLQEWKPKEKEVLPRRASLRIRRIDPDGQQLPDLPEVKPLYSEEDLHERKSAEPIEFKDCARNVKEEQIDHHEKFLTSLKQICKAKTKYSGQKSDQEKFLKSINKMKITPEQVAKVVPQRIFSMAIHPSETKILALAGDKWGRVGIWDVESKDGQDGVYCYEPQSRPIYELRIPKENPSKVYTSSYDGTLKCGDLEKAVFTQVYATPEDQDVRLNGFDFTSSNTAVVGLSGGKMAVVDFRIDGTPAVLEYAADRYSVKGISVHPTNQNYFLTASKSGTVCLWDTRKLTRTNKKPKALQELNHPKSIDGAVFSPITGNSIVTICMDDKIRLYNSEDLNDIKLRYTISHNNHTGRWLTNFRPEWHPARDDVFLVGSMKHPRQIELFNTEGRMVKTFTDGQEYLASVCSLNAFHPTLNVLVGGNSSGRVHMFKD